MSARERARSGGEPRGGQRGHSLIEVMVSIVILSVAIIPMVAMFDVGLALAARAGNLDRARAFAGEQLAYVGTLAYGEARDGFPAAGSAPDGGAYESPAAPIPESAGLPPGATYTVAKQYLLVLPDDPATPSTTLTETATDGGLLRATVTVQWDGGSYVSSLVVADGGA